LSTSGLGDGLGAGLGDGFGDGDGLGDGSGDGLGVSFEPEVVGAGDTETVGCGDGEAEVPPEIGAGLDAPPLLGRGWGVVIVGAAGLGIAAVAGSGDGRVLSKGSQFTGPDCSHSSDPPASAAQTSGLGLPVMSVGRIKATATAARAPTRTGRRLRCSTA
jgi:hypothetical protein